MYRISIIAHLVGTGHIHKIWLHFSIAQYSHTQIP